MGRTPGRTLIQPLVGILTGATALVVLGVTGAGLLADPSGTISVTTAVVVLGLVAAVVMAYQVPIQIDSHQKIYIASVPLYLIAVLLPAGLAPVAAGLSILTAELSVSSRRGLQTSDIATATGRWVIIVLAGTSVAHLPGGGGWLDALPLIGTAIVLWIGDVLTVPLALAPISGDPILKILKVTVREAGVVEGAQYVLGILGALAATQQIWTLALLVLPVALVYRACKAGKEMQDSTRQILESMADMVDLRDPYTGGHSRRVRELCRAILQELAVLDPAGYNTQLILAAARIHDIGKIGIPDHVLHKVGPLTAEERAIMETHPERGADLLLRYPDFAQGAAIVRHHHERWDGAGYPHRLKGTEIPLGARVIAVADSFDAMTTDRPYRRALPIWKAGEILRNGRGTQWDPAVVDAFLRTPTGLTTQVAPRQLSLVPNTVEGEPVSRRANSSRFETAGGGRAGS